jgi:hypothetical protein
MNEPTLTIDPKIGDRLANAAGAATEAIAKAAPHAWEIAVRQQRIAAWGDIAFSLFIFLGLFVVACAIVRAAWKLNEPRSANDDYELKIQRQESAVVKAICWGFALLIALPVAKTYTIDGIVRLWNPEYYTVVDIVSRLHP